MIRPPVPVPVTFARSTLCSRASLRTSGDERTSESSSSSDELAAAGAGAGGGCGSFLFGGWSGAAGAGAAAALAGAEAGADAPFPSPITPTTVLTWTVLPFGNLDFLEHATGGGGNFGVHLVGGDLEERLVALNFVAGLFQPLGNRSLEDRFPHLGHNYVGRHDSLSINPPERRETNKHYIERRCAAARWGVETDVHWKSAH